MDALDRIAEQRIADAVRDGEFVDLPGFGKPLELDDLSGVPAELRASYLLLRSHGYLPPELEARREWLRLEQLLAACTADAERAALAESARAARVRYRLLMEQSAGGSAWLEYEDALLRRITRDG